MTSTVQALITEGEKLDAKASKNWKYAYSTIDNRTFFVSGFGPRMVPSDKTELLHKDDAIFIERSRTLLPQAIAELKRMVEVVEKLQTWNKPLRHTQQCELNKYKFGDAARATQKCTCGWNEIESALSSQKEAT